MSETVKKMTTNNLYGCRKSCELTDGCNGFVYNKEMKQCELKGGDAQISGAKDFTTSGLIPCP